MKKRAPRKQLIEAGRIATKLAIERGLRSKDSVIDMLILDKTAPTLPGLPPYLPHRWTLKASQRMMYDMLLLWKNDSKDQENIGEFFRFVIKEFAIQIENANKEVQETEKNIKTMKTVQNTPVIREIFAPVQKKTTLKALQKFYIDCFAIAVMLKHNDEVSEYAEWFLDWTNSLDHYWSEKENVTEQNKV